jgi:hypothetical protein
MRVYEGHRLVERLDLAPLPCEGPQWAALREDAITGRLLARGVRHLDLADPDAPSLRYADYAPAETPRAELLRRRVIPMAFLAPGVAPPPRPRMTKGGKKGKRS